MLATQESFPAVREYQAKRFRVVAGLFGINLEEGGLADGTRLLTWLAERRENLNVHNPYGGVILGTPPLPDREVFLRHRTSLRRRAASMRRLYDQMGAELLEAAFPEAAAICVSADRLKQFGLTSRPPNANEECLKYMEEHGEDVTDEIEVDDDVPRERTDALLRAEEENLLRLRCLSEAKNIVRQRAVGLGLVLESEADRAIYEMDVETFLEVAEGFPDLSRVDFKPLTALEK
ncbi:MAG: hypothetical protein ACOYMS_07425 [Terrimicrobiaceae bacterium]